MVYGAGTEALLKPPEETSRWRCLGCDWSNCSGGPVLSSLGHNYQVKEYKHGRRGPVGIPHLFTGEPCYIIQSECSHLLYNTETLRFMDLKCNSSWILLSLRVFAYQCLILAIEANSQGAHARAGRANWAGSARQTGSVLTAHLILHLPTWDKASLSVLLG